jgi:hypothetical protein
LAVVSAVVAGALLWWLLAERSESPILARAGRAQGEVTDASAATDRIGLMGTPSTEPVARLAPGAALHWSWPLAGTLLVSCSRWGRRATESRPIH